MVDSVWLLASCLQFRAISFDDLKPINPDAVSKGMDAETGSSVSGEIFAGFQVHHPAGGEP